LAICHSSIEDEKNVYVMLSSVSDYLAGGRGGRVPPLTGFERENQLKKREMRRGKGKEGRGRKEKGREKRGRRDG